MKNMLKNKIALITGGAKGIGKAAAFKFASEGATVIIADVDITAGKQTLEQLKNINQDCGFIECDLSRSEAVRGMFDEISGEFGKLDVIYNNASVYLAGKDGKIADIDEEIWDKVVAINLKSVFLCCKYGIPLLLKNGEGTIINTASSAGMIGIPNCDAYTASKGAVVQLTKSMAAEYGPENIRVNCIAPAAIMTDMVKQSNTGDDTFDEKRFLNLRTPLRRYGTPEEIANIACFLASDQASYLNGAIIVADGGITINGDLSKISGDA